jgi:NTP pyrophosphatase (non-canonical NTP hydrolase)
MLGTDMDITEVQRRAWENKLDKGFNTTDVALEFGLLSAEVGEAFTAWRRQEDDFGAELADVLIYLTCLAQMTGVDLSAEVERKLSVNAGRQYRRDERGVLRRVDG